MENGGVIEFSGLFIVERARALMRARARQL
jgi:hypothetical protein